MLIESVNNFPTAAGLASSASGLAALSKSRLKRYFGAVQLLVYPSSMESTVTSRKLHAVDPAQLVVA